MASEGYHHALSKKKASDSLSESEKLLPVDILGVVMINHGEEFGEDSSFGKLFRANPQRITVLRAEIRRKCARETRTCTLQSCCIAERVCLDIQGYIP